MQKQLDATNKALESVKETLKENSKLTIDYIQDINKRVIDDQEISEMEPPKLRNFQNCLNELTMVTQTYSRT